MPATHDSILARPGWIHDALSAQRSPVFQSLVRAGFAARALTYGAIGGIAAALALGAGGGAGSPNQQGGLTLIAHAPLGEVVIGVAAVGLLAYALWKLSLGVIGVGPEGGGSPKAWHRVSNLAAGAVYVAFFAVAIRVLLGGGGGGAQSRQQNQTAAGVLGWTGGRFLVGAAGVILMLIALYQIYEAVTARFARDNKMAEMSRDEHRLFLLAGRIGLTGRALVFGLVGYFLVRTAVRFRTTGVGIDGALAKVHHQPFGNLLLGLVAAGLLVFAAFSLLEARYQRL